MQASNRGRRKATGKSRMAAVLAAGATVAASALVPQISAAQDQPAAQAPAATAKYNPANDPLFADPYIDIDEWRDGPVRHRYVHGGFRGTDTRFSFYLPPRDQYEGRFFQHVTPVPDSENLAQNLPEGRFNKIGFAIASGAYFVETNGGGKIDLTKGSQSLSDPTITAYKANAAAAAYSRQVALQMYGGERPYGYVYGGSGGAYRTIGSMENTQGVWDGATPYVPGSTMAIPNMFTVRMQALRVLRDKFPQIVDAMEPGGSGDPYQGLTEYEASVLREVEKMGFPMETWFGYETMGLHGFAALYGGVSMADPTYFSDFWTKPGYLGHDRPELFTRDRVKFESTIAGFVTAAEAAEAGLTDAPVEDDERGGVDKAFRGSEEDAARIVGVRLAKVPTIDYFLGGELLPQSGDMAGKRLFLDHVKDDVVLFGIANPAEIAELEVGDTVVVDNSNFLAMETYHRHQVPGPDFPVWDQFRNEDGTPAYPQRQMLLGPLFTRSTSGSTMTGEFDGKMILVASLWDREAMPWQADWYYQRAAKHLGARANDNLRLWYNDHAVHGDHPEGEDPSRIVGYMGMLQQALRDVAAWVETGTAPPQSTAYEIEDGQVIVPDTAAARKGVQPVVNLTVGGGERIVVKTGQPVTFKGTIGVPPGAGSIVGVSWDFEGNGKFESGKPVQPGASSATVSATHRYDRPGTYFVGLMGSAQRQGDAETPYARAENLDRVRVIVE